VFFTGVASGVGYYLLHPSVQSVTMGTAGVTLGIATIGLVIQAARTRVDRPLARFSVRGLTGLAVLLAGRKGPALRDEWRAHLAGESGHDPLTWPKAREAFGFVASAIRCRCSDAAEAAWWTPVDAILKSRMLSNLLVFGLTAVAAVFIHRYEGTLGVLISAGAISAIGSALYKLVNAGRKYRDVKPPEPKARRAKE